MTIGGKSNGRKQHPPYIIRCLTIIKSMHIDGHKVNVITTLYLLQLQ